MRPGRDGAVSGGGEVSYTVYEIKDVLDAIAKLDETVREMDSTARMNYAVVKARLDAILSREADLAKTLAELTADLTGKFAEITTDAADLKAAVAAAIALLQGVVAQNAALKAKIEELLLLNPTPEQLAALQALADGVAAQDADIDASVKNLNDATSANTGS